MALKAALQAVARCSVPYDKLIILKFFLPLSEAAGSFAKPGKLPFGQPAGDALRPLARKF